MLSMRLARHDMDASKSISKGQKELIGIFSTLRDLNLDGKIVDRGSDQLGKGSSSDVFQAKLRQSGELVAVKRIRHFLLEDISFARSVGREVRLWSRLKHPNVLPLIGYFLEGTMVIVNLVSRWMKNGTLKKYMSNCGPYGSLNTFQTCKMVMGIAAGLNYIHCTHRMIHADLKCENILVSDGGEPLLADFGLSVSSSSTSLGDTTCHGEKGSLRWMARELLSTPFNSSALPKHTKMTDMWSFGMVISVSEIHLSKLQSGCLFMF
ncbi:kinase-like protein [Schizopora paradoxa]|uniref:Kinase-like protein n=1 Tax=Schizopora paradoxa TaxID=27342 RepID=A0A0H2R8Q9_9AGAM|nr:kinase-like protein [Schizopora paradoxa]